MYKITRDGETVAMTEAPSYVRRAENGCFTLCQEAEAAGRSEEHTSELQSPWN